MPEQTLYPKDPPDLRYARDPAFRQLVDVMTHLIMQSQFSPSEMREASLLACIRYERMGFRSMTLVVGEDGVAEIAPGKGWYR